MAKTPIEDLRLKGTRFYENLAIHNQNQDDYTGQDFSGRLIDTGDYKGVLTIPIKNKRSKKSGSRLTNSILISGQKVVGDSGNIGDPFTGTHLVVENTNTNPSTTTLTMDLAKEFKFPDALSLVTFGFDSSWRPPFGDIHYDWKNHIPFNSYRCVDAAGHGAWINGGFTDMNDFPIILKNKTVKVEFRSVSKEPIDAKLKPVSVSYVPGIYLVEYTDTSIIFFDHAAKKHVSLDVPAKSDFKFPEGMKVSNIVTRLGVDSANGALIAKLDKDPEFFADYILKSGGWDPKDPANPIPDATRYYPGSEDGGQLFDMLSRAYKTMIIFHAKQGIPYSRIEMKVDKDIKIKINGIEYLYTAGNAGHNNSTTINNALNDGEMKVEFASAADAMHVKKLFFRQNSNADSFVGGFPELTLLSELEVLYINKASFQGPFPKNVITSKLGPNDGSCFKLITMRNFVGEMDLSKLTNPAIKCVEVNGVNCGQITLPKHLESISVPSINIGGGTAPKWQTWADLTEDCPNLKSFYNWDSTGVNGLMPQITRSPNMESYHIGYSNTGPLSPSTGNMFPSMEQNPKMKSMFVDFYHSNGGWYKNWWKINKPNTPWVGHYNEFIPELKNNPLMEVAVFNFRFNAYKSPITKQFEFIPDWSHTKIRQISLSHPAAMQGVLVPANFPITLESFAAQDAEPTWGTWETTKQPWTKALSARLVNFKRLNLYSCPTIITDPSVFDGMLKLTDLDLTVRTSGLGKDCRVGTLCDFTTLPALQKFHLNYVKDIKGTFKPVSPTCTIFELSGAFPSSVDQSSNMVLDGGFPDLSASKFSSFSVGQTTIGHEGAGKNNLPNLTGSKPTLTTLKLFNMPNIKGNMPDLKSFPVMTNFSMVRIDSFTDPIPSIGMTMQSTSNGHSVRISNNKNIIGYAGGATAQDGNIHTKIINYQDNNLTATAVEEIIIAFSKGGALGGCELYLDNPAYEASKTANPSDNTKWQQWHNKAPDVTKKSVKDALAILATKTVKIEYQK